MADLEPQMMGSVTHPNLRQLRTGGMLHPNLRALVTAAMPDLNRSQLVMVPKADLDPHLIMTSTMAPPCRMRS
jgi:hypothetical protein